MGLLILVETLARHGFDDRPQEAVVEVAIGEIAPGACPPREMGAAFPIGTAWPKEGPDSDGWRDTVDFAVAQARRMRSQAAEHFQLGFVYICKLWIVDPVIIQIII